MPKNLDLRQVGANAQHVWEWVTSDPEPPHGRLDFIPLSVREHFDHYVPAMFAEIQRLRAELTTIESRTLARADLAKANPSVPDMLTMTFYVTALDEANRKVQRLTTEQRELFAEETRLRGHSTTLNTIAWKVATALGDVPAGADRIEGDPVEQVDRLVAEITRLRAEAVGDGP